MFLTPLELRDTADSAWELGAPLVYSSAVEDAPPGITVPVGFRTDFRFIPPPARGWVTPVGIATAPAVVYAFLRSQRISREIAIKVFQEALTAAGVPKSRRSLLLLSL